MGKTYKDGYKRVARNVELALTKNDSTNRYGLKVVPNKKRKVAKFNWRRELTNS